jgi:hypothetical protein
MEVQMKRLCFVALLSFAGVVLPVVSAHAFGIFGSWWNMDDSDVDGWGGGIRQEIPLLPWGKDDDDDDYSTTAHGDSVVIHHDDDNGDDYEADDSLVRLSLDTRASFVRFSDSDTDFDLNVIPIEVGAMVGLGVLYAELGGGYYFMDADDPGVENAWGWFALAGVMLGKGTKGLFGEVIWRDLSADLEDVDVDVGDLPESLDAAGIGFNVGVSFGI